ncbi:HAD-like domain-containing protein [Lactarius quietus]|nr:HAD-like domain-containing protein [Lactarius quietus]
MGIEVNLMTGDGRVTALVVARQVRIVPEVVRPDMRPKSKVSVVAELMEKGIWGRGDGTNDVTQVGDRIKDSPPLVAATVGIALSSSTSLAIEAADIVLMHPDFLDVVAALDLSCSKFRTIRRNLIWACVYNVLNIPLTMAFFSPLGLHLHPMMAFSFVSIVTSSLLLRGWVRPMQSIMLDEMDAVAGRESACVVARVAAGDGWGAMRERLHFATMRGNTQLDTDESV